MGRPIIPLIGKRLGRLLVLEQATSQSHPSGQVSIRWTALCDCGNTTIVAGSALRTNSTRSCGCLAKRIRANTRNNHIKTRHAAAMLVPLKNGGKRTRAPRRFLQALAKEYGLHVHTITAIVAGTIQGTRSESQKKAKGTDENRARMSASWKN